MNVIFNLLDIRTSFVMIALSVAKIYVKTPSIDLSLRCSQKVVLVYKWGRLTLETKLYARNITTTKTRFVVH